MKANFLKITSTVVTTLLLSVSAFAYESELECPNMKAAYAKALAAKQLVSRKDETFNELTKILEAIENGLIYKHCDIKGINQAPSEKVVVVIEDSLFNCPQETVVKQLVVSTKIHLEKAEPVFGGFRVAAINRSTELVNKLRADLKANEACQ